MPEVLARLRSNAAPQSARLEDAGQVGPGEKADEPLTVEHETPPWVLGQIAHHFDELVVLLEDRHLVAGEHAVADRPLIPLSPWHLGNAPEREEPDYAAVVRNGIRGVAPGPHDLVHEVPQRHVRPDRLRLADHQVADAEPAQRVADGQ